LHEMFVRRAASRAGGAQRYPSRDGRAARGWPSQALNSSCELWLKSGRCPSGHCTSGHLSQLGFLSLDGWVPFPRYTKPPGVSTGPSVPKPPGLSLSDWGRSFFIRAGGPDGLHPVQPAEMMKVRASGAPMREARQGWVLTPEWVSWEQAQGGVLFACLNNLQETKPPTASARPRAGVVSLSQ
jgi:hypothetical protein